MSKPGWVYLMASAPRGTLYLGVTSNLMNRVQQHRMGHFEGFTARYNVKRLVWNEAYPDIADTIRREKAMKFWKRDWKIRLIEEHNPQWLDLAVDWGFPPIGD
ncbi:GIY-YIG nuclease family protein [Sandarakinorhabdus sp. AAP62]|uniref:GIY-YIG nuclease family protein n=1 Tax=Sandarakinorhabdus sp. AAP62 TaxID=1248916 RepID=UPI0002E01748|nr:GIY-YIG nuclease family protein [Sandarakinorhabdus sp. AAP62]